MAGQATKGAGFLQRHDNVFAYVPNLIGYVRVVLAVYAFAVALHHPWQCMLCYFFSFVCDELDGRFARKLDQCSTLGAVLDMVTDRLATTGLLLLLAVLYPQYLVFPVILIFLDIFSHWFQMYSTLLVGATTHKDTRSASWLVRTYYKYRIFMGFCCVCCEVLYLCIYGLAFPELRQFRVEQLRFTLPAQILSMEPDLATVFDGQGLPVLALLALIAVPGVMVKQICNWAQFTASAGTLVEHDLKKMKRA